MTLNRAEMSCGRTKILPNQTTRTVTNRDQNKLDFCGELSPCISITIMNILIKKNHHEIFVFIFRFRWDFYPAKNEFLNMLYIDI